MARATTTQIRLRGADLVRALHAAAAFTYADKKSHRHCINLRTVGQDDTMSLVVGGGSPTRVLVASAGKATGDQLAVDLTPGAAAVIVKLFAGSDDVALKHDGKVLAVTAQDQLFDNQRIEVRTLPIDPKADAVRIASTAIVTAKNPESGDIALTPDDAVTIAKAAKALGVGYTVEAVQLGDVTGVSVLIGSSAVAYVRGRLVEGQYLPALFETMGDEHAPVDGSPWYADHIHLGHILDGVAPLHAVKTTEDGMPDVEAVDGDDAGVDLDDEVEIELPDLSLVERPVSLAAVLADDDTVDGAA